MLAAATPAVAADLHVVWHPAEPRIGDVAWMFVRSAPDASSVEGSVGGRPLHFFPYAGSFAALVGVDLEMQPGKHSWRLAVLEPGKEPVAIKGSVRIRPRHFQVERLTLPRAQVDLDPETERRAIAEGDRLKTLYRTISPERLWRGRFTRPVAGRDQPTGFGSRRILNGQPRMPHAGVDFTAPRGAGVVAANSGRVALVAEFFFPGRLVAIDHGLGLYTLYFHLDTVAVREDDRVDRGQPIGTVGATGRATGPHLHFGAQLGQARVDPAALLVLDFRD